jgi:hypothetical protein
VGLTPRQLSALLSLVDLQSFTLAADVLGVLPRRGFDDSPGSGDRIVTASP